VYFYIKSYKYKVMAKFFLITYDLKSPGQNYNKLYESIKAFGEWQHPLESTWFIKVSNDINAETIYNSVRPNMDSNDNLFIVDITDRNYYGWLSKNFWPWFKNI